MKADCSLKKYVKVFAFWYQYYFRTAQYGADVFVQGICYLLLFIQIANNSDVCIIEILYFVQLYENYTVSGIDKIK